MAIENREAANVVELLLRYETTLRGYLFACVRNFNDSDDLYQEVCLAITKDFRRLDSPANFAKWAIAIAQNRVRSHFAKRDRDERLIKRIEELSRAACRVSDANSPESSRDDALKTALSHCLDRLTEQSRRLIAGRYASDDSDLTELSSQFGRTKNSLAAALCRIRKRLHSCIRMQTT